MRSAISLIAAGLLILGIGLGIGIERHWLDETGNGGIALPAGETALEHARKHLDPVYVCPMHAEIVATGPGGCPICGMDLVPKEPVAEAKGEEGGLPVVSVPPEFIHNFGVRTAPVARGPVARHIEAIGRVARMPQPKLTDVKPTLPGRVLFVSEKGTSDAVRKGEWLFTLDSPQWRALQQQFLEAQADDAERATQLRQRLLGLGMDNGRMARLAEEGSIDETLRVRSPRAGTIVEWTVSAGDSVPSGSTVVTLGGVNRISVNISLFEGQGAWIRRGQRAVFRVPTVPGVEFEGRVDRTDREINYSTRTLPIYAGFNTADPRIRYGMLVEVEIEASARQNVLRIPREALIQTGTGTRVIVARGEGRFQPVEVIPGLESAEHVEIVSGLEEGQEVVISGQFLIDSESSLRAGFRRMETVHDDR